MRICHTGFILESINSLQHYPYEQGAVKQSSELGLRELPHTGISLFVAPRVHRSVYLSRALCNMVFGVYSQGEPNKSGAYEA